jgi:extracellular elastinolytic metalloproteinase
MKQPNPIQVTTNQATARLSTRTAASPEAAARQFIQDRAELWQLNDQDVGTVGVVSVSTSGLPTVRVATRTAHILRMNTAFIATTLV